MSSTSETYKECILLNNIISAKYEYLKLLEGKEAQSSLARIITVLRSSIFQYISEQIIKRMFSSDDLEEFPESRFFFNSIGISKKTSELLNTEVSLYELVTIGGKDLENKIKTFCHEENEEALILFYVKRLGDMIEKLKMRGNHKIEEEFVLDPENVKLVLSYLTKKNTKSEENEDKNKFFPAKFISNFKKIKKRITAWSSSDQISDLKNYQLSQSDADENCGQSQKSEKYLTDERMGELFEELKESAETHILFEKRVMAFCDVCRKYIMRGVVCRHCRLKFHDKCAGSGQNVCISKKKFKSFIEKLKLEADQSQNVSLMANKMKATLLLSPLDITPSDTPTSNVDRSPFKDSLAESNDVQNDSVFVFPDWAIKYEELKIISKLETRQSSTVFRGYWHGDVAIKVFKGDKINRELFIREVSLLMTIRHDSLIQFMGMCTEFPHLIIVTRFCRGRKLHEYLRHKKRKPPYKRRISFALQISQAVGYLHSRGILYCDLRPQNVFINDGKVTITNFGLHNLTFSPGNENNNSFRIEPGWLSYLAPEIIRKLRYPGAPLHFTKSSDVFAFGCLFYEIMALKRPFEDFLPHQVILHVGRGILPPIGSLCVPPEVMDVIMNCMKFEEKARPNFSSLISRLSSIYVKHKKNFSMKVRIK